MNTTLQFYAATLLVYSGVAVMACLGLHVQYSCAGIVNLGFVIYQAAGAYVAGVLTLGPSTPASQGGFQEYIGGSRLPFPLPLLAAAAAGALLSLLSGLIVLSRLRRDYQATVLLVLAVVVNQVVGNAKGLFNGYSGLSLIPPPLQSWLGLSSIGYDWAYAAYTAVLTLAVYRCVRLLTRAPLGLAWRALRDNDTAAAALGKEVVRLRLTALAVGGAIAGLSGAVLVQFISVWSPQSWLFPETLALFTALIVGGLGNDRGVVVGALVVLVLFLQAPSFLPQFLRPGFTSALEWVSTALLTLAFLWFRPQGLVPERIQRLAVVRAPGGKATAGAPIPAVTREHLMIAPGHPAPQGHPAAGDPLRVLGLRRNYGGVNAVAGVSFTVPAAGITGLIGPNGAGKTTTVAMIAGEVRPTSGRVMFHGQDVTRQPPGRRARAGLIRTFQLSSEFKRLTVLENLLVAAGGPGETATGALLRRRAWRAHRTLVLAKATELLERYGLAHQANVYAGDLSSGEKRLVEIMRALMAGPSLLLLDEPMAGVHPALHGRIEAHLRDLCQRGLTMLMVEHELSIVERCCARVIVMARGAKIAEGTMPQIRASDEVKRAYLA